MLMHHILDQMDQIPILVHILLLLLHLLLLLPSIIKHLFQHLLKSSLWFQTLNFVALCVPEFLPTFGNPIGIRLHIGLSSTEFLLLPFLLKQQSDLGTQWGFKMFYYTTECCTYLGTQWGFKIGTLRVSPSRLYGLWYKQDNTGLRARQRLDPGQPHYK